jgi:phage FluMu protein Com
LIPQFTCSKCGAIGDVELVHPPTDEAIAQAQSWMGTFLDWVDPAHLDRAIRLYDSLLAEREKGEHLSCSCPRCGYEWEETPLDQRSDSPTQSKD